MAAVNRVSGMAGMCNPVVPGLHIGVEPEMDPEFETGGDASVLLL
jgi:hypothetical protein